MDATRAFVANNRMSLMNVVYFIVVAFVIYLVYVYFLADSGNERYVLQIPITRSVYGLKGNSRSSVFPTAGGSGPTKSQYCLNYDDSKRDVTPNPTLRIREGGDFTFSWWMYINAWNNTQMNVIKPVICISDANVSNLQLGADSAYIMTTFLYPNETKLGIRFHTRPTDQRSLTWNNNFVDASTNPAGAQQHFGNHNNVPVCDIQDIDMQRWINITVVVSGRVVDIYYDGKLNRSCILPGPVMGSSGSTPQYANTSLSGGFNGYLNSMFFAGSALTPDRIYGIYQSGPQGNAGLFGSLFSKLGINLAYRSPQ
jgi:hypothetical protein